MENIKFKYYAIGDDSKKVSCEIFTLDEIESYPKDRIWNFAESLCENIVTYRKQYTRLKDKNNIEIYDGDIIELYLDGKYINNYICEFKDGCFMFKEIGSDWIGIITNTEFEVIGNIYENPDLLKG